MLLQIGTLLIFSLAHRHPMGSLRQAKRHQGLNHIRALKDNLQRFTVERDDDLVSSAFARFTGLDLEHSRQRENISDYLCTVDHDFVLGHQPG